MAQVRQIRASDLSSVWELSTVAGWNQSPEDWRRLITLQPDGCFCLEEEGRVVSTTTCVCYEKSVAWIGMVLTLPAYRGRGFARRLVTHALDWLDANQVECAMLDATELGQPLYEKLGFVPEYPVERWIRRPQTQAGPDATLQRFQALQWQKSDREAFGADRTRLLESLSNHSSIALLGQGYALGRPGRLASYFGPAIASDADCARTLLMSFLASHESEQVMWDLIPVNRDYVRLARAFGFDPMRNLTRMRRGGEYKKPSTLLLALAGFEYG